MNKYYCEDCKRDFSSEDALAMHNNAKHGKPYSQQSSVDFMKYGKYGIIILVIIGLFFLYNWYTEPPKDAPKLTISPASHDFGYVSQAKGTVSTTITLSNAGLSDLVISSMDTSCGCTSAAIIDGGIEGPTFSMAMHGTNPTDWEQVLTPGESAELKIYYDPNVHRELRGQVTRSVFIQSNDPVNPKMEVRIHADQTA